MVGGSLLGAAGTAIYLCKKNLTIEENRRRTIDSMEEFDRYQILSEGSNYGCIFAGVMHREYINREDMLETLEKVDYPLDIIFGGNLCHGSKKAMKIIKKNKNISLHYLTPYHAEKINNTLRKNNAGHYVVVDGKNYYREGWHEEIELPTCMEESVNKPLECIPLMKHFRMMLKYTKKVDKTRIIDTILENKGNILYTKEPDRSTPLIASQKIINKMKEELGEITEKKQTIQKNG